MPRQLSPAPLPRHRVGRGYRMYNPAYHIQKQFYEICQPFLPTKPLEGPIEIMLLFGFPRPKNHRRSNGRLKDGLSVWYDRITGKLRLS